VVGGAGICDLVGDRGRNHHRGVEGVSPAAAGSKSSSTVAMMLVMEAPGVA
jgi:hypothetical protein